jgi:hypothetical protein
MMTRAALHVVYDHRVGHVPRVAWELYTIRRLLFTDVIDKQNPCHLERLHRQVVQSAVRRFVMPRNHRTARGRERNAQRKRNMHMQRYVCLVSKSRQQR